MVAAGSRLLRQDAENGEVLAGVLYWDEESPPRQNYEKIGNRLAAKGGLYRRPGEMGLLLVEEDGRHRTILKANDLAATIVDRVEVCVLRGGKAKGGLIASTHLDTMLRADAFLECFPALQAVTRVPTFLGADFALTQPGINGTHEGQKVLYVGDVPAVSDSLDATNKFLDTMAFETESDRTNALAAAVTIALRNYWPGGKPIILVTATKSHAGKDTVISFACADTPSISISYQRTDWALERSFVGARRSSPDAGIIVFDNARMDRSSPFISSAFVERFVTDPEPFLFSTGTGVPVRRANNQVVAISTNDGQVSEDLANRSLPIHLAPRGSIESRVSRIGNPRHEYLPAHRAQIAAEIRGLIVRWRDAGMPLADNIDHPFSIWAKVVGGILVHAGFRGFLANFRRRKVSADPRRDGLSILGAAHPDVCLTATEWAYRIVELGVVKAVIRQADRESPVSRARGAGVVLSAHEDELFTAETDTHRLTLRLEKARARGGAKNPRVTYRFSMVESVELDEDP